jgi:hypothetical protein
MCHYQSLLAGTHPQIKGTGQRSRSVSLVQEINRHGGLEGLERNAQAGDACANAGILLQEEAASAEGAMHMLSLRRLLLDEDEDSISKWNQRSY